MFLILQESIISCRRQLLDMEKVVHLKVRVGGSGHVLRYRIYYHLFIEQRTCYDSLNAMTNC